MRHEKLEIILLVGFPTAVDMPLKQANGEE